MKVFKIILFTGCILVSLQVSGQKIKSFNPEEVLIEPGTLNRIVYLYNKVDIKILYSVSLDCQTWQSEQLSSLKDVVFRTNLYVSLGTGDEQVIYLLKKGNSYFIDWDNEEDKYVIMRRKNENSD